MSAPSSSRLPLLVALLLLAAVVAGGCTVPGSGHLYRPPKDLPPSLDYVTADVMGFSLLDTDPESKLWAPFGQEAAQDQLASVISPLAEDADPSAWIGPTTGVALRELNIDGDDETSTLWFADVDKRDKLDDALERVGWKRRGTKLDSPAEALTLWTRGAPPCDEPGEGEFAPKCFELGPTYHAIAVADDAVIAAESTKALKTFLRAARQYSVPERKSMSEYAVEARKRSPMSFVTRFDLIRTQLKRPFEGDPATLEFARWATDSNTVIALRDGWLGVAPPLDREATDRFRIVGASEWVPDLAPDLDMKPVTRDAFERLAPMTDVAIGIHNPGQQLRELVRAITFGSGQYVTEQDVPKDEQVDLLPTLDELDGDAAVGWRDGSVLARVTADDPEALARDVNDALATAKAQGKAIPHDGGLDIAVATPWGGSSLVHDGKTSRAIITGLGTAPAEHLALLDESGIPRRPPVLWIWKRGGDCTGDAAGWVTFDNVDELRFSIAVERVEQPTCQVGVTLRTLQSLDLSDGVISN